MEKLDHIDLAILKTLQENGRISNQDLAAAVHLSPAQSNRRHRRLGDAAARNGTAGKWALL